MTQQNVYRINFVGRKVVCGTLIIEEHKHTLVLDVKLLKKFSIPNFKIATYGNKIDSFKEFILLKKGELFLKEFQRKPKVKRKLRKTTGVSGKIKKELKEIAAKEQERMESKKLEDKKFKKSLNQLKSKHKLKYDIFENTHDKPIGTFADVFKPDDIKKIHNTVNYSNNIQDTDEPLYKPAEISTFYKKETEEFNKLILWDIENVHFYDDFAILSRLLPKDSYKVFSYSKKNKQKKIFLKGDNLDFVLQKLKKRNWIARRTTKIADNELIKEYQQRKNKIKELYLISADRDFEEICIDAINSGIKVHILNNEYRNKYSWFNNSVYEYKLIKNKKDI